MTLILDGIDALGVGLLGGGTTWAINASRRVPAASDPLVRTTTTTAGSARRVYVLAAVVTGMVIGLASGWPVAGCWGAVAGWGAVGLHDRDRAGKRSVERLDGRASWVGLVRGQLVGRSSLALALRQSTERAPAVVADECAALRSALVGVPAVDALAKWREVLVGDADAQQVATVMLLAAQKGAAPAQVLDQLAGQLRSRAASARRIERERRRVRLAGRCVALITVVWILAGARLDHRLFGFYSGFGGQVLLAAIIGVEALGLWSMARVDRHLA